jgi:chromosome segregation ATPase
LANQQKRVEFKENSYQEQLRKLNEKYTLSENERQKLTFDYNSLLAKLEETEKRNQATAKEKDRAYTEEKNKLNKRIDQLTQTLDKAKEDLAEKEVQLAETGGQLKAAAKRDGEREERLGAAESELELTKMLLKKELDQRKLHEKEIEGYKIVEEERNALRKKHNDLAQELSKLSEKFERTNSDLNNSEARVKEL